MDMNLSKTPVTRRLSLCLVNANTELKKAIAQLDGQSDKRTKPEFNPPQNVTSQRRRFSYDHAFRVVETQRLNEESPSTQLDGLQDNNSGDNDSLESSSGVTQLEENRQFETVPLESRGRNRSHSVPMSTSNDNVYTAGRRMSSSGIESKPTDQRRKSVLGTKSNQENNRYIETQRHETRRKCIADSEPMLKPGNRQRRASISNVHMIKRNENKVPDCVAIARKILNEIDKEKENNQSAVRAHAMNKHNGKDDFTDHSTRREPEVETLISAEDSKQSTHRNAHSVVEAGINAAPFATSNAQRQGQTNVAVSPGYQNVVDDENKSNIQISDSTNRIVQATPAQRSRGTCNTLQGMDNMFAEWNGGLKRGSNDFKTVQKDILRKKNDVDKEWREHVLNLRINSDTAFQSYLGRKRASLPTQSLLNVNRQSADSGSLRNGDSFVPSRNRRESNLLEVGNSVNREHRKKHNTILDTSNIKPDKYSKALNDDKEHLAKAIPEQKARSRCVGSSLKIEEYVSPSKSGGRHTEERNQKKSNTPFRMQMYLQGLEKNYPTKTILEIQRLKDKIEDPTACDVD